MNFIEAASCHKTLIDDFPFTLWCWKDPNHGYGFTWEERTIDGDLYLIAAVDNGCMMTGDRTENDWMKMPGAWLLV